MSVPNRHTLSLDGEELVEITQRAGVLFSAYFKGLDWEFEDITACARLTALHDGAGVKTHDHVYGWDVTFVAVVPALGIEVTLT